MINSIYDLDFDKTMCFTGHRPSKLFGYDYRIEGNRVMLLKLRELIIELIERRGVDTFISGMAIGVDMWSARIILKLKETYPHIKLVCAIPCAEQYKKWSREDKEVYLNILEVSDFNYYVSEEEYTPWCMHVRDKWMVDNSKFVIAVWDEEEDGGTWGTIKHARKRQRAITYLNPKTLEVKRGG